LKGKKEILIAILVLTSVGLFYFGFGYLKGSNLFASGRTYYAIYGNVAGINNDDPVSVNGFRIGKIRSSTLIPDEDVVVLELEVSHSGLNIPEDSRAIIANTGLLGGKEIDIEMGFSSVFLGDGDTITSGTEQDIFSSLSSSLEPFEKKALEAVVSIDSVMKLVQVVLNQKNRTNLESSMQDVAETMDNLNATSADLKSLIASESSNIKKVIENLGKVSNDFAQISDSLKDIKFNETIHRVNASLDNANAILGKINSGEGTMGKLVNNDSLYLYLESASKDLDLLLIDFKENPKRYVHFSVFGKKEKSEKK
jgi:phospholipid/cholesterol/gamma-HCH transport system substrate-binding protein|tara:strand:- start:6587 stop:7519 length:933 start_codon:yes stop_codon:yes gene_type:complete